MWAFRLENRREVHAHNAHNVHDVVAPQEVHDTRSPRAWTGGITSWDHGPPFEPPRCSGAVTTRDPRHTRGVWSKESKPKDAVIRKRLFILGGFSQPQDSQPTHRSSNLPKLSLSCPKNRPKHPGACAHAPGTRLPEAPGAASPLTASMTWCIRFSTAWDSAESRTGTETGFRDRNGRRKDGTETWSGMCWILELNRVGCGC